MADLHVPDLKIELAEVNEVLSLMAQSATSPQFSEEMAKHCVEYQAGAMWGISFATAYVNHFVTRMSAVNTPVEKAEEPLRFPCNYCGECAIWQAAYIEGSGLETSGDVIAACQAHDCPYVGRLVEEVINNG